MHTDFGITDSSLVLLCSAMKDSDLHELKGERVAVTLKVKLMIPQKCVEYQV
jgi:hypothetical protein